MTGRADVTMVVTRFGGVATWSQLRRRVHWRHIRTSVESGQIVRIARGRYALPTAAEARTAASRLAAVASHTSAAAHWGWSVKLVPEHPHLTVARNRRVDVARRVDIVLHWRDLGAQDVHDRWVTSPARTVIDCCLDLPFDEALSVFDSALRGGLAMPAVFEALQRLPARCRTRVLGVARAADARAANPFESVLRAIANEVPGLHVTPQRVVRDGDFRARVDLADQELRLVLEADSYEFHGGRSAFARDCRRYNGLVVRDWLVLRLSWEDVMFRPGVVRELLVALVSVRRARPVRRTCATPDNARKTA